MTSLNIFSLIKNCEKFAKKNKNVYLDLLVSETWYRKSPTFIIKKCKYIWNLIENNYFSYKDFKIFLLYNFIFYNRLRWEDFDERNINNINKLFTENQYEKDKQVLLEVNKKVKLNGIEDFFKINEGGENYIYCLIMKRLVSPFTFLKFYDKLNLKNEHNESDSYKKFIRIVQEIKLQMKN